MYIHLYFQWILCAKLIDFVSVMYLSINLIINKQFAQKMRISLSCIKAKGKMKIDLNIIIDSLMFFSRFTFKIIYTLIAHNQILFVLILEPYFIIWPYYHVPCETLQNQARLLYNHNLSFKYGMSLYIRLKALKSMDCTQSCNNQCVLKKSKCLWHGQKIGLRM